jgi:uncharacterized protein (TIGR03089 family)
MTPPYGAETPADLLDAALRRDPARPLVTFYDDATGERTELSVTTFANWVAKTANLLRDDLAAEPGGTVAVDLPAHWQAAVWLQAAWTVGLHVVPPGRPTDIAVIGYGGEAPRDAADVVALGLAALGLPRQDSAAPDGTTLDYDREVPGHGDRFVPTGRFDPAAPALTAEGRTLTGARLLELVGEAVDAGEPAPGSRLLLTGPFDTVDRVVHGLLVPLATEATLVLCRNLDPARLADRLAQEGVVAALDDTSGTPRWPAR